MLCLSNDFTYPIELALYVTIYFTLFAILYRHTNFKGSP